MRKEYILAVASALLMTTGAFAQVTLTEVWRVDSNDDRSWMPLAGSQANTRVVRSLAYHAGLDQVLIPSRANAAAATGTKLARLNPVTGADVAVTELTGISGGTFTMLALDTDEAPSNQVVYFGNLTTNIGTTAFKIYRMTDPTATTATEAFNATDGGLGAARLGDTLAVSGSGTATEIWAGTSGVTGAGSAQLVKFTTADGSTFTRTAFLTLGDGSVPRARLGLDVKGTGTSAVIWANTSGNNPAQVDPATGALGTTFAPNPNSTTGVGYEGIGPQEFLTVAPGAGITVSGGDNAQVWEVTPTPAHVGNTISLADIDPLTTNPFPNADGTSDADYDTTRNNVIIAVTNNSVTAHSLSPLLFPTAINDWNLF